MIESALSTDELMLMRCSTVAKRQQIALQLK